MGSGGICLREYAPFRSEFSPKSKKPHPLLSLSFQKDLLDLSLAGLAILLCNVTRSESLIRGHQSRVVITLILNMYSLLNKQWYRLALGASLLTAVVNTAVAINTGSLPYVDICGTVKVNGQPTQNVLV